MDQIAPLNLQELMERFPQVETPIQHTFAGGVYVREMFIPAGTLILGKRHRKETVNMVIRGSISIYSETDPPKRIDAPAIFVSPAMGRKLGFAHEDTLFVNVHSVTGQTLEEIENEVIIPENEYQLLHKEELCLGSQQQ